MQVISQKLQIAHKTHTCDAGLMIADTLEADELILEDLLSEEECKPFYEAKENNFQIKKGEQYIRMYIGSDEVNMKATLYFKPKLLKIWSKICSMYL